MFVFKGIRGRIEAKIVPAIFFMERNSSGDSLPRVLDAALGTGFSCGKQTRQTKFLPY